MGMAFTALLLAFCLWRAGLACYLWRLDRRAAARGWPKDFHALNQYNTLPPEAPNAAALIWAAGSASDAGAEHDEDVWSRHREQLDTHHGAGELNDGTFKQEHEAFDGKFQASFAEAMAEAEALLRAHRQHLEDDVAAFNALLDSYEATTDYLEDRLPGDTPPLSEEWRKGIAQSLALRAHVFPLYEKAATIGTAHFPVDFTRWPDSAKELGDSWIAVKQGVEIFQRQAILHADTGDTQAAVVALEKSLRLLSALETLPTVIAQLAWMGLVSDTVETLRFILSVGLPERDQVQQVDGWLADLHNHNAYDVAWAGERCILRGRFDIRDVRPEAEALEVWNVAQEEYADDALDPEAPRAFSQHPTSPKPGPGNWRLVYELPYKLAGLETLDCALSMRAVDKGYTLSRKTREAKYAHLEAYHASSQATSRWRLPNARRFLIDPSKLLLSTVATESTISAARTALLVEQYRIKHGMLPNALSDLANTIEGAESVHYERNAKGYVIAFKDLKDEKSVSFEVSR